LKQPAPIPSKERLIRNGRSRADRHARRLCLEALEEALRAVDPVKNVHAWLRRQRGRLLVGDFSIRIPERIRVLAVGKASVPMLTAALSVLGNHVTSGILVAPTTEKITGFDKRIIEFHTGHPIPDEEGVRASEHVMTSIRRMRTDELLLCLISGGASAMLPAPVDRVTLADKRQITKRLIQSRATIHEINTVRKHLSELKGGRLIEKCGAGRMISLIISDVPGNTLCDIASGLTAPDPTTFQDAINVLREFDLWTHAPKTVRNHLQQGSMRHIRDTPKPGNEIFRKVRNVIIADNHVACEAARITLKIRRIPATVLSSSVDIEARSLGQLLGSVATDSESFGKPLGRPGAVVLGGETTVDVKGLGRGGRNQEVALAALRSIAGLKGVAIAALGTDGIDGKSPAAGALVDGQSMARATRLGLHARRFMARNDSYSFFRRLDDCIITGPTGTNVGDVCLLVRAPRT
jgi:glycerate 2-kinase